MSMSMSIYVKKISPITSPLLSYFNTRISTKKNPYSTILSLSLSTPPIPLPYLGIQSRSRSYILPPYILPPSQVNTNTNPITNTNKITIIYRKPANLPTRKPTHLPTYSLKSPSTVQYSTAQPLVSFLFFSFLFSSFLFFPLDTYLDLPKDTKGYLTYMYLSYI